MARKGKSDRGKSPRKRGGSAYERVVADVVKAMDPAASVRQGEWVTGPDGARELDVVVEGTADGQKRTLLIECKDFDPAGTGPVGIGHVDALESKRRDLGVDVALLCSNAGFTTPAIRKAGRVGIGLIGVMKKGDARIRVLIPESLYTRRVQAKEVALELHHRGKPLVLSDTPFGSILYDGTPLANWIWWRAFLLVGRNPIVEGRITADYQLKKGITIELPRGLASVDRITFQLTVTGAWYVQEVTYDASTGLYDWLRRRVRLAPGPSQFHINNVNIDGGDWIDRPPEYALENYVLESDGDFLPGETVASLALLTGFAVTDPVPEIDPLVRPEDLDLVIKLTPEAYTSAEPDAASP